MKRFIKISIFLIALLTVSAPLNGLAQPSMPPDVADRLVNIKSCIDCLEKTGNLVRVQSEIDPKHQLAGIANHIVGRPIHFIKAQTVNVPAFADAQFVIEAEILPNIRKPEGPFAEVTGYYGQRDKRWVMRVKAITRQKNPVFHTLLSRQEVWNAVGFTGEAKIFVTVNKVVPDLKAVNLPPGGCGFCAAVIQLEKSKEGVQKEAILQALKAFPSLQSVVAVDTDVNIYEPIDVEWALTTPFNAKKGMIILKDQPGHILNPMVEDEVVTKIGMDATAPYPRTAPFERVKFKEVNLRDYKIKE